MAPERSVQRAYDALPPQLATSCFGMPVGGSGPAGGSAIIGADARHSTAYAIETGQRNYSTWAPLMAPIKVIMCIGVTLMLLQAIACFFRDLAMARGRPLA